MRLIDADELINYFYYGIDDKPIIDGISDRKIIDIIKNQPTAYDIDKVIEQLEEQKSGLTEWAEDEAFKLATNNAIEIVKQSGVAESEQKLKEMESGNNGTME